MFKIVDNLFDLLRDENVLWYQENIDENAYEKYKKAENPLLKFYGEISAIIDEHDPIFLGNYTMRITMIFKYLISPSLDKLFL